MALNPFEKVGDAAGYIKDITTALTRITMLEENQKDLSDSFKDHGHRLRELEVEIKVLKAEATLEAVTAAGQVVVSVQSEFNQRLLDIILDVDRLKRDHGAAQGAIDGEVVSPSPKKLKAPRKNK